ncbi:MAG: ATP-binding cassette domain-containing protein [Bacteroidota bacterium]
MLEAKGITFAYNPNQSFAFPEISCQAGTPLLILGESGKGKTTLLHLLAGLLRPSSGSIQVADTQLETLSTQQLDQFRGRHIGVIFQAAHFVSALSVQENLVMAQYLAGVKPNKEKISSLMERLGLREKLGQKPFRLSQGQQQRVAIARALVNQPKVILADEPTSSLDDTNCYRVLEILEEQANEARAALIIVTHDYRLKEKFPHQVLL